MRSLSEIMTLQLVSYGTRIRCGVYRPHARFVHAVDFVCGGALAALVTPDIGDGPLNIVAQGLRALTDASVLEVTRTHFIVDGVAHAKRALRAYSARVSAAPQSAPVFLRNVRMCADAVHAHAPPQSVPRLLAGTAHTGFTRCLAAQMRRGIRQLQRGEFAAGTHTLKGLGYGLTPSGDDFLAGFLLGCRVLETMRGLDLAARRRTILRHALGANPLSNAFLRCAHAGWPSARMSALLCALAQPGGADVPASTKRVLAVGATSGADTASGFLTALRSVT